MTATQPAARDAERSARPAARTLREARLDRIAEGKTRLWRASLRLSQLANALILAFAIPFLIWREWALGASIVAAAITVGGMACFARWMAPREQQLRRHMAFLARRRRTCASCDYALHDLTGRRCPECGAAFDPQDTRHILRAETVRLYSSRARVVSGIIIVFALIWVGALARREAWPVHAALFLGLLAAFHVLHGLWMWQARRAESPRGQEPAAPGDRPPPAPEPRRCPDCAAPLCTLHDRVPPKCPRCARPLTFGDVFIRPDIRHLSDRRIATIQYRSLLLRWVFFLSVCGGLAVLTNIDPRIMGRMMPRGGGATRFLAIVLPVVVWVLVSTILFRRRARSLQRRLRRLFAGIAPACAHCDHDLSDVPAGGPCPRCRRPVRARLITG